MKNCAVYYYIAAHMRGCCPALHVSRVDRAAQPGAMGAPSYVQPDHWDQAAHQLFYRSQAPADQLLFAKKAHLLPLSPTSYIRLHRVCMM